MLYLASVGLTGSAARAAKSRLGVGGAQAERDAAEVRGRQLHHLQLGTGLLQKYGKLQGSISPSEYATMLGELLDCVQLVSPAPVGGLITSESAGGSGSGSGSGSGGGGASGSDGSSTRHSLKPLPSNKRRQHNNAKLFGKSPSPSMAHTGKSKSAFGRRRVSARVVYDESKYDEGKHSSQSNISQRPQRSVAPPLGLPAHRPDMTRMESRTTRALGTLGLSGFRGILREMCAVHSFEDLATVELTPDVKVCVISL